ncbi:MAG: acylphosphatase [Planctomycetes bacterium]|nr:acylphosphatase [Planctomycetota bacterium]
MKRLHVFFSGRVQGVYFRQTCFDLSSNFEVGGFVQNLSDGRVELVAEGEIAALYDFLNAIAKAKAANISEIEVVVSDPQGGFDRFEIRR